MPTLLRLIFMVPLGFILACVAAALMIAISLFGYQDEPQFVFGFIVSVVIMTSWAGAVAVLPALIAIVLAEAFAWRSVLYYLLVGGAIGLLADRASDLAGRLQFADRRLIVLLAAGFIGGFCYWLIAGSRAGMPPSSGSRSEPA